MSQPSSRSRFTSQWEVLSVQPNVGAVPLHITYGMLVLRVRLAPSTSRSGCRGCWTTPYWPSKRCRHSSHANDESQLQQRQTRDQRQNPNHNPRLKRALISNAITLLQILINPLTARDSLTVASSNLVVDKSAQETAVEVKSVGLVEPGNVPVVLEEEFCEDGVDFADALNASTQGFEFLLEDVKGSLGV